MSVVKKIFGFLLIFLVIVAFSACTKKIDRSWTIKFSGGFLPEGVFKYYLKESYGKAVDILSSAEISPDTFSRQQIEGKSFDDWIKTDAIKSCEDLLTLEHMFRAENLKFTEIEVKNIDSITDDVYNSAVQDFNKLGIGKEDIKKAYSECRIMYQKLYDYYYGSNGKFPIGEESMQKYYSDNYACYSTINKYLIDDDQSSLEESAEVSPETISKAKNQFDNYISKINSGEKTFKEIADVFKKDENLDSDPIVTDTVNLNFANIPDQLLDKLKNIDYGKADYIIFEGMIMCFCKNKLEDLNTNESIREEVFFNVKRNEFYDTISKEKNSLKIETNTEYLKEFTPSIIFKET